MLSASPWVEIDTGKMCNNSAPAAYSVWRGPGTLETVMFAAGGSTSDRVERLCHSARIWTLTGRASLDRVDICPLKARHGCGISFHVAGCASIASSRALGDSRLSAIE